MAVVLPNSYPLIASFILVGQERAPSSRMAFKPIWSVASTILCICTWNSQLMVVPTSFTRSLISCVKAAVQGKFEGQ